MIGNHVRVKVVKNKVAPPFQEAEFDIMFGKGISREGDVLDLAVKNDIIMKSGAWYSYNGEKIGQGRENAKAYLADNPAVFEEAERLVRCKYLEKKAEEEAKAVAKAGAADAGVDTNAEDSKKSAAAGKEPAKKRASAKES